LAVLRLAKYTVSEVRQRIERPLADARGSDRSRDREGAECLEYATVFLKLCTKLRAINRRRCSKGVGMGFGGLRYWVAVTAA
jgi:hypothetical protein